MEIQWALVFFTLFVGIGTGVFAYVAVAELMDKMEPIRRKGAILALCAVILGGIASVFHLSHPFRAVNVLGHLNTSVGRELLFLGIVVVLIAAYILMLRGNSSSSTKKTVSVAGLIFCIVLAFEVGATYILPARPAWNTYLLPLAYLVSAGVLGIFVIYVLLLRAQGEETQLGWVNRLAFTAIIVQAVCMFTYVSNTAVYFNTPVITSGTGSLLFWLGVVLIGLAVPFILTLRFIQSKKNAQGIAVISLVCVLIGGIAFRALMYVLGSGVNLIG